MLTHVSNVFMGAAHGRGLLRQRAGRDGDVVGGDCQADRGVVAAPAAA